MTRWSGLLRLTKRSLIRAQSKYTQVEIAMTERFKLGIHPPIRESGDIADTTGCVLESPNDSVQIDRGVICALRHIHMSPQEALRYGVRDKSFVRVRITGDRELIFGDVLVRVDPSFKLAMHIDTDEGNAASTESKVRDTRAAKNFNLTNQSTYQPPRTNAAYLHKK